MKPRYEIINDEQAPKSRYEIVEDKPSYYPKQNVSGFLPKLGRAAGIAGQDISNIPDEIKDFLIRSANAAPSEIPGALKQVLFHTPRAVGNIAVGAEDYAKNLLNIPSDIAHYAGHLGLISPETSETARNVLKARNQIPEQALIKRMMGEQKPGDVLLQDVVPFIPGLPKIAKGAGTTYKATSNLVTGAPKYAALAERLGVPGKQAELDRLTLEQKQLQESHQTAQEAEELAKQNQAVAQSQAQAEIGKSTPEKITYEKTGAEQKLNEVDQNISGLTHQMENIPEVKELPPSDTSHVEESKAATEAANQSEQNLTYANEHHELASNLLPEADNRIAQHLNPTADYPVRTSRQLKNEIQSTNKYWSDEYKDMMGDLKKSGFQLKNPVSVDGIREAIKKAKKEYGHDPYGEFSQVISKAPTGKDITASDFMAKQKDFRDARYDLLQRTKTEPSAVKRDELFKVYRDSKPFEDFINKVLYEGLGEHSPRYNDIMRGYREQVYPLRENAIANKVMEGKPLSSDISGDLSGDQEGQELLRGMANRNPEIQRNIVGQQYKKNHELVHNPDERLREYTNNMPDLNQLVGHRENVLNSIDRASQNVESAKESHTQALANEKQRQEYAIQKEKELDKVKKEHGEQLKQTKEQQSKLQKDLSKHHEERKRFEERIPKLEKHISILGEKKNALQEENKKTDLTLKKKVENESKMKELRAEITRRNRELRNTHFGYKFIGHIIKKIAKKTPGIGGYIK